MRPDSPQARAAREGLEAVAALLAAFDARESVFAEELPPALADLASSLARKRGAEKAMFRAAEREGLDTVFTTDRRDFSVYRSSGRRRFRILP